MLRQAEHAGVLPRGADRANHSREMGFEGNASMRSSHGRRAGIRFLPWCGLMAGLAAVLAQQDASTQSLIRYYQENR